MGKIKSHIRRILSFILIFIFLLSACTPITVRAADSSFSVEYIDVGQGDCALIQCDGHYMMIDGGPASASRTVYSILRQKGIKTIDVMIATHPDADHIGGLAGALNYAEVGICYSPVTEHDTKTFKSLVKYLGIYDAELTVPKAGDTFDLGSARVDILGPLTVSGDDSNNNSIVAKITYGDTSFLFMGDAEREEEYALIRSKADLSCDVLKVGHHGSAGSTTLSLLSKTNPEYAVISVGADNDYGHPTAETLQRLKAGKVEIYRTDLEGDITCISDGKNISISTEKTVDADKIWKAGAKDNSSVSGTAADSEISTSAGIAADSGTTASSETGTTSSAAVYEDENKGNATDNAASAALSYVLNTNTKKFHYPNCSSVGDMKAGNREDVTATREEILAQGYVPCKRCNP